MRTFDYTASPILHTPISPVTYLSTWPIPSQGSANFRHCSIIHFYASQFSTESPKQTLLRWLVPRTVNQIRSSFLQMIVTTPSPTTTPKLPPTASRMSCYSRGVAQLALCCYFPLPGAAEAAAAALAEAACCPFVSVCYQRTHSPAQHDALRRIQTIIAFAGVLVGGLIIMAA